MIGWLCVGTVLIELSAVSSAPLNVFQKCMFPFEDPQISVLQEGKSINKGGKRNEGKGHTCHWKSNKE